MDNGEVISGLNDGWTLGGAKLMEWVSGFMSMMIASSILKMNVTAWAPVLALGAFFVTMSLAKLRREFPDEEKGVANLCMSSLGFAPPGIPKPAKIQPYWSASPIRELKETCDFMYLGLDEVFFSKEENEEEF